MKYFLIFEAQSRKLKLQIKNVQLQIFFMTAPLSVTASHQHRVDTPWKKSLKNQGVFNILDNSRTPHFNTYKTSRTPLKISPTLRKMYSEHKKI